MEEDGEPSTNTESVPKAGGSTESATIKSEQKPRFVGLYREDVVQSALQPGVMGMVTKVAGDSDSDSSSDSEGEDEDAEAISQGCARICWTNLEESTERIEDIRVVDRAFLHGDIVAAVSSPLGQTGTVVNVDLRVDLELPNGEILNDVDSRKIKRIRPFVVGDYVIHDHWLGRVDEVVDNVTVLFDDGSKCKVFRADPERLVPIPVSSTDDSNCPYYPGQRVRGSSSALFKTARWLKGSWRSNRMEGTVTDVEVGSVVVYWIAAAHTGHNYQSTAIPSEQQDPKRLRRMPDLSYTSWELGDRALLPQRLAKKTPAIVTVPVPVEGAHSECETETVGNAAQGPASDSVEAGNDSILETRDSASDSWVAYRRKLKRRFSKPKKKAHKKDDFVERASLIVGTKTKVDVVWQDGTRKHGLDACTLFPVDHLGDHDFWPEQHVMEKSSDLEGSESESRHVGIVKSVDSKQRTAKVKWLQLVDCPQEACQLGSEEVVSVYGLVEHPDYNYCLGDVVIRLCSTSNSGTEACSAPVLEESDVTAHSAVEGESEQGHEGVRKVSRAEALDMGKKEKDEAAGSVSSPDLSFVGIIIGLQDGEIEVMWADGELSKVGPQAIFVVGRDDDDGSSQNSGIEEVEEADDAGSWTTMDSSEMNEAETGEQELDELNWDENATWEGRKDVCDTVDQGHRSSEGSSQMNGHGQSGDTVSHGLGATLSFPFTALIRALRFAAGLLWSFRGSNRNLGSGEGFGNSAYQNQIVQKLGLAKDLDEAGSTSEQSPELSETLQTEQSPSGNTVALSGRSGVPTENHCELIDFPGTDSAIGSRECIDAAPDELQEQLSPEREDTSVSGVEPSRVHISTVFKHFDSVKDSSDHFFTNERGQPSNQRRWSKKIQQEWIILEKNLPDTIYVRVYEDRMDLIRSVIVGAAGTPYHDGLFFFDFYLPPEYPSVPPVAHYHSGGLRLNPNLYETGKVCLSLLNTWTGKGNEIWHPSTSSILQVLVSVQGLVLNAKPYFNEAGYDRQIGTAEGEKNSLAYSENAFLLSCKSMLYLIRRPPKHFEEFVLDHFKARGPYILQACNAYMQGSPVGSLLEDATVSPLHCTETGQTSSTGFRLMIAKLVPRLATAFVEIGANCEQYEQLVAGNS